MQAFFNTFSQILKNNTALTIQFVSIIEDVIEKSQFLKRIIQRKSYTVKPVPCMVSAVPFLAPHKKSTIFV